MDEREKKHLKWIAIYVAVFAVLWYFARQEARIDSEQVRTSCVRESYEASREYGGSQREWERDCLRQREEDALDRLNTRTP